MSKPMHDVIRAEQLAKTYAEGKLHTQVFDGLIDLDRNGIAVAAAQWSMEQMVRIRGALA